MQSTKPGTVTLTPDVEQIPQVQTVNQRNIKRKHKEYVQRPFTVFDGEGITMPDGSHRYILFCAKSETDGILHEIHDENGLTDYAIFWHIVQTMAAYPGAINVIYGGSYDFNMWLYGHANMDKLLLDRIYHGHYTKLGRYRIKWTRGKSFYCGIPDERVGGTIYDCVTFFQTTFVKACDSYLGERFINRERIVSQKAARSSFSMDELPEILDYTNDELDNLILLMNELRDRLAAVGLFPKRWDGPGAVAAYLLQREKVSAARAVVAERIAQAARFAYAGGRFEVLKFGHMLKRCFEYDINSAYPAALLNVPDLTTGTWKHHKWTKNRQPVKVQPFSLVHIAWELTDSSIPGPLFKRAADGTVSYPMKGSGWYWTPEYETLVEYSKRTEMWFTVHETYEYHERGAKPFAFIRNLYEQRKMLKRAKNGAHVGIKLALNSLYGKLAQQIGWRIDNDGKVRIPPFHQLEWAGYTTSWCRARILRAVLDSLDKVIAFETDAVFSAVPLDICVEDNLGDFEVTVFDNLTYMQSGTYFGDVDGKPQTAKTRGIDRGRLTRDECLMLMKQPRAIDRKVAVSLTRFNTAGLALMQGMHKWARWEPLEKHVTLEPTGKRIHSPVCGCNMARGLQRGQWHLTLCPIMDGLPSAEFPIDWENPDPAMTELSDLRDTPNEWQDADLVDIRR